MTWPKEAGSLPRERQMMSWGHRAGAGGRVAVLDAQVCVWVSDWGGGSKGLCESLAREGGGGGISLEVFWGP